MSDGWTKVLIDVFCNEGGRNKGVTILDGELLDMDQLRKSSDNNEGDDDDMWTAMAKSKQANNAKQKSVFFIFDVCYWQGSDEIAWEPDVFERLSYPIQAIDEKFDASFDAASTEFLSMDKLQFGLVVKQFFPLSDYQSVFNNIIVEQSKGPSKEWLFQYPENYFDATSIPISDVKIPIDGVIFTPAYRIYHNYYAIKFKPAHLLTIDFILSVGDMRKKARNFKRREKDFEARNGDEGWGRDEEEENLEEKQQEEEEENDDGDYVEIKAFLQRSSENGNDRIRMTNVFCDIDLLNEIVHSSPPTSHASSKDNKESKGRGHQRKRSREDIDDVFVVLECMWDIQKSKWIVLKRRVDKTQSNSVSTGWSVLESLCEHLSLEELDEYLYHTYVNASGRIEEGRGHEDERKEEEDGMNSEQELDMEMLTQSMNSLDAQIQNQPHLYGIPNDSQSQPQTSDQQPQENHQPIPTDPLASLNNLQVSSGQLPTTNEPPEGSSDLFSSLMKNKEYKPFVPSFGPNDNKSPSEPKQLTNPDPRLQESQKFPQLPPPVQNPRQTQQQVHQTQYQNQNQNHQTGYQNPQHQQQQSYNPSNSAPYYQNPRPPPQYPYHQQQHPQYSQQPYDPRNPGYNHQGGDHQHQKQQQKQQQYSQSSSTPYHPQQQQQPSSYSPQHQPNLSPHPHHQSSPPHPPSPPQNPHQTVTPLYSTEDYAANQSYQHSRGGRGRGRYQERGHSSSRGYSSPRGGGGEDSYGRFGRGRGPRGRWRERGSGRSNSSNQNGDGRHQPQNHLQNEVLQKQQADYRYHQTGLIRIFCLFLPPHSYFSIVFILDGEVAQHYDNIQQIRNERKVLQVSQSDIISVLLLLNIMLLLIYIL